MVAQNTRAHLSHPLQGGAPYTANIMMLNSMIGISTQAKNYDITELPKDQPSTSHSNGPFNIEKLYLDLFPHPPKGGLHQIVYNPNSQASQHYSIVEDLAQEPCAMSTLEVLQSCSKQRKELLSSIGGTDPLESDILTFDVDQSDPCLSHQLSS